MCNCKLREILRKRKYISDNETYFRIRNRVSRTAQFYNKKRLESMTIAFRELNRSHTCLVSKARPILLRWQVYKRR